MINRVVIASHVFAFGTSQALDAYFRRKGIEALFIGHKLFGNVFTWLYGALATYFTILFSGKKYDLFVGSNNLNAFVGLLAQRSGLVKRVIYFSPDYVRNRFDNGFLNRVYRRLDRYCIEHCEVTWNSSAYADPDPMMLAREMDGFPPELRQKQIQVPDGTDLREILPYSEIYRRRIGFVGHLRAGMGGCELIDAFREIALRVQDAELLLIGSGPEEPIMRQLAENIPNIEMTGYMGDIAEVYDRLSKCAIAVAPYEEGSISQFTDPGKVKVYLSVGLPIVINRVPLIADEIGREKCGVAVEAGDRAAFVDAVVQLLTDDTLYQEYRENTLRLRDRYTWDNIFDKALKDFL